MQDKFRTLDGQQLEYPLFFPDATRGMVRATDNQDVESTGTQGVLVNTYHLWRMISQSRMEKFGGVAKFMNYKGAIISDSGGFQVMSIVKKSPSNGKVTDEGVYFKPPNSARLLLTPEESIEYQLSMKTDLVVVLDDFTQEGATPTEARVSVERTIAWAKRSKIAFDKGCRARGYSLDQRPYLVAVNQGGRDIALRKECNARLAELGFTAYGHGGDGFNEARKIDLSLSRAVAESAPPGSLLYGLGVGKPEDVVALYRQGYRIFDCVLPTRDARHGRLYVYKAESAQEIDLSSSDFYEYYSPTRSTNSDATEPISKVCDCHTCRNYTRAYIAHLSRVRDTLFYRLATIHNLRFYAMLMDKLRLSS